MTRTSPHDPPPAELKTSRNAFEDDGGAFGAGFTDNGNTGPSVGRFSLGRRAHVLVKKKEKNKKKKRAG